MLRLVGDTAEEKAFRLLWSTQVIYLCRDVPVAITHNSILPWHGMPYRPHGLQAIWIVPTDRIVANVRIEIQAFLSAPSDPGSATGQDRPDKPETRSNPSLRSIRREILQSRLPEDMRAVGPGRQS